MTPSVLTTCQMVSDAKSYCLIFLKLPQWMYQRFLTGSKKKKKCKDRSSRKKRLTEEGVSFKPPGPKGKNLAIILLSLVSNSAVAALATRLVN